MSTVIRLGKRSLSIVETDDSDDDSDIQIIEVKKPRCSKNEDKGSTNSKIFHVLNFLENSPRLKHILNVILSTFGFHRDTEVAVEESEQWDDVPAQEENHPPVPKCLAGSSKEKLLRSTPVHFQNTCKKSDRNTFVTLQPTSNNFSSHPDPLYAHRRKQVCESNAVHTIPQNLISDCEDKRPKGTLLNGTGSNYSFTSRDNSSHIFFDAGGDSPSNRTNGSFAPQVDDTQLLTTKNKKRTNCTVVSETNKQCLNDSVIEIPHWPTNGFDIARHFYNSKKVQKSKIKKSAFLREKYCSSIPYSLRSKRNFHYKHYKFPQRRFTTDEVVKMQEREQYEELLHRYSNEQWDEQEKPKPLNTPPKFMKNAHVLRNMRELNTMGNHFGKRSNQRAKQSDSSVSTACKNSSLTSSGSNDIKSDDDEPVFLKTTSKAVDTTISKGSTAPSLVTARGYSNLVEDNILSTPVNGSTNGLGIRYQSSGSDYSKSSKNQLPGSNESPEIICDGVKPKTKSITNGTSSKMYQRNGSNRNSHSLLNSFENAHNGTKMFLTSKNNFNSSSVRSPGPSQYSFEDRDPVKKLTDLQSTDHSSLFNGSKPKRRSILSSSSWIKNLKEIMEREVEEREKLVADQEQQLKEYKRNQMNKYAKFKKLFDRDDEEAPDIICLEKEPPLPSLTPQMEEIIDDALTPRYPNAVMSTASNFSVLWKDIDTLSGSNWLNDEIINCYMLLIQERSKLENYLSVYAFTSFFYPKLKSHGYAAVKRWTRKVDIFGFDLLFIPLHLGVHWCLAVIDNRYKRIQYYDSMDGNEHCLPILRDYLIAEHVDKKKQEFDASGWVLEKIKNIPPQLNGSDCGMFTLKYAEYIARNVKINFSQQNMHYFRRKMVYEIITGQLL